MATGSADPLKGLCIDIRSVLISSAAKGGRSLDEVARDYKEMNCKPVPFREHGFPSLEALFVELQRRNVCSVLRGVVYPVATEETAHTLRLVQQQKKPGGKGKRGGGGGGKGGRGKGTRGMGTSALAKAYGFNQPARGVPAGPSRGFPTSGGGAFGQGFPRPGNGPATTGMGAARAQPNLRTNLGFGQRPNAPPKPLIARAPPPSQPEPKKAPAPFGAQRPVIANNGIREVNFNLAAAAAERNRRPPQATQPVPAPIKKTVTPPRTPTDFQDVSPPPRVASPTPSLPAALNRSKPPAAYTTANAGGRGRWTKGHVTKEDDWSKAWSVKDESCGKRAGRRSMEIRLAQYEDLGRIHLIRASASPQLRALENDIAKDFADRNKAPTALNAMSFWLPMLKRDLQPGIHTLVHIKTDTADLGWNRAQVLKVGDSRTELQCLDYGTRVEVSSERIHHLPAHLATTPRLARPFRCFGWDPELFSVPDEDKLEDFVLRFCSVDGLENVRLVADLVEEAADGRLAAVNIFREDAETGEWLELADELMKTGYVCARPQAQAEANALAKRLAAAL